jgi:N-acetylmuramoyl-L-alanine amidase
MRRVDRTKLRLIREAIEDNIDGAQRTRAGLSAPPRRIVPLSLFGSMLIASIVYLSAPLPVVSEGVPLPPDAVSLMSTVGRAHAVSLSPGVDVPRSVPRRVNRSVFPLAVRRIVVDPGHGGAQQGAVSDTGVAEKDITLDIGQRLRPLLEAAGFDVKMTRERDQTLSLEDRVAFANASGADLFVSIHVNWIARREIRPLETYHAGPTDDPAALRVASLENQESGYSLADYRRLLERIYLDARRDESRTLARSVNGELYRELSRVNPAIENRGVKTAPFIVLIGTEMPAILVEVSSLSNRDEVGLLTRGDYREQVAVALLRGIEAYAKDLNGVHKEGR